MKTNYLSNLASFNVKYNLNNWGGENNIYPN